VSRDAQDFVNVIVAFGTLAPLRRARTNWLLTAKKQPLNVNVIVAFGTLAPLRRARTSWLLTAKKQPALNAGVGLVSGSSRASQAIPIAALAGEFAEEGIPGVLNRARAWGVTWCRIASAAVS
jgi:hypothetical protein